MSSQEPKPATLKELKAACPNADPAFLLAQAEAEATVEAAKSAWMVELDKRLADTKAELDKAKQAPPPAPQAASGVDPLPAGAGKPKAAADADEACDAFEEAVKAEMDRTNCARHVAHAKVCRTQPDLRAALVASHNAAYSHVVNRSRR